MDQHVRHHEMLSYHEQLEVLWWEHEYLQDQVKFADEKAARVVSWNMAIIAGMYAANLFPLGLQQAISGPGFVSVAVLFICTISLGHAALVVQPRLSIPLGRRTPVGREPGWVFYGDLLKLGTGFAYYQHFAGRHPQQLLVELCDQNVTMAGIVHRKHYYAKFATLHLIIAVFAAATRVVLLPM